MHSGFLEISSLGLICNKLLTFPGGLSLCELNVWAFYLAIDTFGLCQPHSSVVNSPILVATVDCYIMLSMNSNCVLFMFQTALPSIKFWNRQTSSFKSACLLLTCVPVFPCKVRYCLSPLISSIWMCLFIQRRACMSPSVNSSRLRACGIQRLPICQTWSCAKGPWLWHCLLHDLVTHWQQTSSTCQPWGCMGRCWRQMEAGQGRERVSRVTLTTICSLHTSSLLSCTGAIITETLHYVNSVSSPMFVSYWVLAVHSKLKFYKNPCFHLLYLYSDRPLFC